MYMHEKILKLYSLYKDMTYKKYDLLGNTEIEHITILC